MSTVDAAERHPVGRRSAARPLPRFHTGEPPPFRAGSVDSDLKGAVGTVPGVSDDEIVLTNPNGAKRKDVRLVLDGAELRIQSRTGTGGLRTKVVKHDTLAEAGTRYAGELSALLYEGFVHLNTVAGRARPGELLIRCAARESQSIFDLSPDGATLVTRTYDDRFRKTGEVDLVDVATGRRTTVGTHPPGPVDDAGRWFESVRFDGTGTRLVSTFGGDTRVLDLTTGETRVIASFDPAAGRLAPGRMRPCFDAARKRLLVYDDDTARVLDGDESVFGLPLTGHAHPTAGALSPSGRLLALGFRDGTIDVWNVDSGQRIDGQPFRLGREVGRVGFDPADRRLLAASGHVEAAVWNLADRRLIHPGTEARGVSWTSWTYSPDGARLVMWGGLAAFHDPETLRRLPIDPIPMGLYAGSVVFSADGSLMAVGGDYLSVYRTPEKG